MIKQVIDNELPVTPRIREDRIAERAYFLWLARACPADTADEDWYEAEREILSEEGHSGQSLGERFLPPQD